MWFFFGLFLGVVLSILVLVIEIYLNPRQKGMAQMKRFIEEKTREKGAIIMPVSDSVRSTEDKIKQNERMGIDTNLDDILL